MSELQALLASPPHSVSIAQLTEHWRSERITVRLANLGGLADDWRLIAAVRGAWGRSLMQGASAEAISGKPCPWSPPCALGVFFVELARSGREAVSKPYVFQFDRAGADLNVSLLLFGASGDWATAAAHALVDALNHRIDWTHGKRLPVNLKTAITDVSFNSLMPDPLDEGSGVVLDLLTPLDDETGDCLDNPSAIISRLVRRISALAPWQGAALVEDWSYLSETWKSLDYDLTDLSVQKVVRNVRKSGLIERRGLIGRIGIEGPRLEVLLPFLSLAHMTGIGRGATAGQGRVVVNPF